MNHVLFFRDEKYDKSNNRHFMNQCEQYSHWNGTMSSKNNMVQPEPFHTSAS